jgi:hypothetical protein
MMKKILATAAMMAGLGLIAGEAAAANSAAYCNTVATNYVNNYTHPLGSAAVGCGVGALLGQVLTNGNGAAVAGGCAAGAGTGLVLSNAKRQQLFNDAFNDCMYGGGGGGGSQQVVYGPGPAPSGYDGGYQVGSSDWMYACSLKYKSFQVNGPNAGQFKKQVNPTVWAWCNLPG